MEMTQSIKLFVLMIQRTKFGMEMTQSIKLSVLMIQRTKFGMEINSDGDDPINNVVRFDDTKNKVWHGGQLGWR